METLEDGLHASVQEWDRPGSDSAAQAKSVSFQLPAAQLSHQHKVLDSSSGGASAASHASTASASSSSSSASSLHSDSTWMFYGGMSARLQPEDVALCPGCRRHTIDCTDTTAVRGLALFPSSCLRSAK